MRDDEQQVKIELLSLRRCVSQLNRFVGFFQMFVCLPRGEMPWIPPYRSKTSPRLPGRASERSDDQSGGRGHRGPNFQLLPLQFHKGEWSWGWGGGNQPIGPSEPPWARSASSLQSRQITSGASWQHTFFPVWLNTFTASWRKTIYRVAPT